MEVAVNKKVARVLEEKGTVVHAIAPDATVYEALEKMAVENVGALVVLDGERLVGIMSERDYARKVILLDRGSHETLVSEIMTSDLHTVTPDTTVGECMAMMTEQRIRHLPVLDDSRLVGVVSIGDVVRAVITEQQYMIEQLEHYITG